MTLAGFCRKSENHFALGNVADVSIVRQDSDHRPTKQGLEFLHLIFRQHFGSSFQVLITIVRICTTLKMHSLDLDFHRLPPPERPPRGMAA